MKQKNNSLQALRAWCCLCVFAHHCGFDIVTWAVSVFFTMSAFLLTRSSTERETDFSLNPLRSLAYAWGKVKKLYPLYIVTLLPILLINLYASYKGAFGQSYGNIVKELVLSAFLVQSWSPTYCMAFNGVAWYLSTSFFLYFAFPYINAIIRRYRKRSDAVIAMVILFCVEVVLCALLPKLKTVFAPVVSTADYGFEKWFTFIFPPFKLLDFALGCNLGWLYAKRNKEASENVIRLIDLAAIVIYIVSVIIFRRTQSDASTEWFRCTLLFVPFSLVLVLDFVLEKGLVPRIVTNRYTVFLGNISGFFYLIHQDLIRGLSMVWDYLGFPSAYFRYSAFVIVFPITVALSVLYAKLLSAKTRSVVRGAR